MGIPLDKTSETQIRRQLDAMRTDSFELLLLRFGDSTEASLSNETSASLLRRLPWLKAKNVQGFNINIRPTGTHLSMLDDLSRAQLDEMERTGYEPSVIVETSPANFQAWLDHGRDLSPEEAHEFSKLLARITGSDMGAFGRRHAGRLAGFTNRKANRRLANGYYPFVRLHKATQTSFTAASGLSLPAAEPAPTPPPQRAASPIYYQAPRVLRTIEQFHDDPRYDFDLSRADYAYAIYAHCHGMSEREIIEQILRRDMKKKGNQAAQHKYAKYTVGRAINRRRN
jgi:hypothetical protein